MGTQEIRQMNKSTILHLVDMKVLNIKIKNNRIIFPVFAPAALHLNNEYHERSSALGTALGLYSPVSVAVTGISVFRLHTGSCSVGI